MGIFIRKAIMVISHHVSMDRRVSVEVSDIVDRGNIVVSCSILRARIDISRGSDPNKV